MDAPVPDSPPLAESEPLSAPGPAPVPPVMTASGGEEAKLKRRPVRLHPDTDQRLLYWSGRRDLSANAYIVEAIEEKIRRENQDYDLPTLEIARLNQLLDEMAALTVNVGNLETVTLRGFDSLIGLTRGDNYLLEEEDGELGVVDP